MLKEVVLLLGGGGPERLVLRSPEGEVGSEGSEVGRAASIRKTNPSNPRKSPQTCQLGPQGGFGRFCR